MARKSATDQQLEDLQQFLDESYLQDPANRRALAAQGAPLPPLKSANLPGSDASNPVSGDEEGAATTDENGITAVSAVDTQTEPGYDDLDALNAETVKLQQATADRRAADKLRKEQPETDAAGRQAIADQVQRAIGNAQRVSQATQGGIRDRVFAAADRIGAVSTPGGIGALLVIIMLLLLILIPVNGQPRLVWLWLVLTRKAHLMSEDEAEALGSGTPGIAENAPSHSEGQAQAQSQSQPQAQGQAYAQVPTSGANITPINIASHSERVVGTSEALGRYINP